MPSSPAIWRRIIETRWASVPPARRSTSGTSPKPTPSSSASIGSSLSTVSRATLSPPGGQRQRGGGSGLGLRNASGRPLRSRTADRTAAPRRYQERDLRQPRHQREREDHAAGDERRLALRQDLLGDLRAEVALGGVAGDDDARRHRDQERRDLGGEAVADGQDRVRAGSLSVKRQVALQHADDDAADEVDAGDQHGGRRVAPDELRGTVHRAVEVGLAGDVSAPLARLLVGDHAGVEVGVDRHLLARHRVEREARGDFGDASGAVGDDDELDHDQDRGR